MKVVGLLSGGKDSCFNLCHCARNGHELVALATLVPPGGHDELDSYMYQTVGHDAVHVVAAAIGVPLYRATITGAALDIDAEYGARTLDPNDETEDLFRLLVHVKAQHPDIEGVSVGAILSNYQRVRVEHVARRRELGLVPLAYLWQRNQSSLLAEMATSGLVAALIKVAGIGLAERDLGKTLQQLQPKLEHLHALYDAHVCGEGGEYETLTLDAPIFRRRVELRTTEAVLHSDAAFANVSYLRIRDAQLADKPADACGADAVRRCIHPPPLLDPLSHAVLRAAAEAPASASVPPPPGAAGAPAADVLRAAHLTVCGVSRAHSGPFSDEAAAAFAALADTLAQHRLSFEHVCHVNVYLASLDDLPALDAVAARCFGASPPSRAAVAVPLAGAPRVMLDAVAAPVRRRTLHVQSRSYWAPASTGPYAQAAMAGVRTTVAAQIGLVPATMQLCSGLAEQAVLALQHARRIVLATREWNYSAREGFVEGAICWVAAAEMHALVSSIWSAQPDTDDDADHAHPHQHLDDSTWRGAPVPPLLVVQVARDGLPHAAAAAWQLTTNCGRASYDADDEYQAPTATLRGSGTAGDVAVTYCTNGYSGAAHLALAPHAAGDALPAGVLDSIARASHVRVFYTGSDPRLLERICTPRAATHIRVHAWSLAGHAPTSEGAAVFWLS